MRGGEQQDSMGLAKSLRQSCPYGSVHVSGATALGKLCQKIDLWSCVSHHPILALVPPSILSIFPPWERTWGQLVSPGLAGLSICLKAMGSLLGGCISVMVPFGHWVTSLLVTCAVDNCHFLWFPYYFQKFQDFDLGFDPFPSCCKESSFLV